MGRRWFPFHMLLVSLLCTACRTSDIPASTPPPATATDRYVTVAAVEGEGTALAVEVGETAGVVGAEDETEMAEEGHGAGLGTPEPEETSSSATTKPVVTQHPGDADILLYGWIAGDYLEDGRIAGTWVRVEKVDAGEPDYPGLPHYDCFGGCYVPVVAETCPLPETGTLEMVRVSGRNLDRSFGLDVCVPGGSMVPTGGTAEGDPADLVHFLAIYKEKDLYNRESTILATVVEVLSGSPDCFSEVVRIKDKESSFWEPTGGSFEEGMTLEVFAWSEDPVAEGWPFAVFSAAFLIWDR